MLTAFKVLLKDYEDTKNFDQMQPPDSLLSRPPNINANLILLSPVILEHTLPQEPKHVLLVYLKLNLLPPPLDRNHFILLLVIPAQLKIKPPLLSRNI